MRGSIRLLGRNMNGTSEKAAHCLRAQRDAGYFTAK